MPMMMANQDQQAKMMHMFNRTANSKNSSKQREQRQAQDSVHNSPAPSSTSKETTQPVTGEVDESDRSNNDQTADISSVDYSSSDNYCEQIDVDAELLPCDEHQGNYSSRQFSLSMSIRKLDENHVITPSGSSQDNELRARQSLSFIDDKTGGSVVTETYTRPRTASCDMEALYYNEGDYETFRRDKFIDEQLVKVAQFTKPSAVVITPGDADDLDKPVRGDGQRSVKVRLNGRQRRRRSLDIDPSLNSSFSVPNGQSSIAACVVMD